MPDLLDFHGVSAHNLSVFIRPLAHLHKGEICYALAISTDEKVH